MCGEMNVRTFHVLLVAVLWHLTAANEVRDPRSEIKSRQLLDSVALMGHNVLCPEHATTIVKAIISNHRTTIKNLVIFTTQDIHGELNNFDEFLVVLAASYTDKTMRVLPLRNSGDTDVNLAKLPQNSGKGEIDDATDDENVGKVAHFRVMAENITWNRGNRRPKLDYHPHQMVGGGHDLMDLGTDTILLFLQKSLQLEDLGNIIAIQPTLIKILFTYGESWCTESQSFITQHLTAFMENQFRVSRHRFLYAIPLCSTRGETESDPQCSINNLFMYNAFWKSNNSTNTWGRLETVDLNGFCTKSLCTQNGSAAPSAYRDESREALSGNMMPENMNSTTRMLPLMDKKIHLNGFPLKLVFFPTAMAFLKANSTILERKLSPAAREFPFNDTEAYFGLDVEVLKELSRRMKFTPNIMLPSDNKDYGFKEENGTFNGALGDVIYERADFIMNGLFVKDYESKQLQFSTPIDGDRLCIVVRSADLIPNSLLITKCFAPIVWLVMILTILIVAAGYHGLLVVSSRAIQFDGGENRNNSEDGNFHMTSTVGRRWGIPLNLHVGFKIIALMLSAPVGGVGSSSHERLFVSVCLLWSLNLTGAFQGSLVNIYTNSISYRNIDTLADLDKSGIPIAVVHAGLIVDLLGSEPPGTLLGNLRQKMYTFTEENDVILSQIASKGDLAALQRLVDMPKIFQQFVRQDGVPLIHVISECPRSYRLAYLFPKSSIFLNTASHYFSLFAQSGLVRKWYDDTMRIFTLEGTHQNRHFIRTQAIILTVSHLQTAFYILAFGLSVSFVVFLLELTQFKNINFRN